VDEPVVLVVDDSPTVRKIVQLTLQREHIRVVTAGDGLSALAAVADEQPDLILLDIMLPRMDGYNICQIVRKNMAYRDLPIIMLSGKDGLFDKMRGKLAGSTEYMTKPFDSAELAQTIKRYLDSPAVRERAARRAHQQQERLRRRI
jgi:twitching motility two-component system response regulator PilG